MRLLSIAAVAVFLTSPAGWAQSEVTLLSPGSVQPSMEELVAKYQAKTAKKVTPTFASGGVTRGQVMRGEVYDVIILQPPYADVLASGHVDAASETPLATISLGLAAKQGAPKPDISTAAALKKVLLNAKGVSYPDEPGGQSGITFMKALKTLGIYDEMQPNLKHGSTGPSTMDFVLRGEAEYGVTFMSGLNRPGLEAVGPMPRDVAPPTGYVAFLSAHVRDKAAAKAFLDYIGSAEAATAFTARGFQPGR